MIQELQKVVDRVEELSQTVALEILKVLTIVINSEATLFQGVSGHGY